MKRLNILLTIILVFSIATCGVISGAMIAWSQSSGPGESTYSYTLVSTAAYCDVDAMPLSGKSGSLGGNLNSRVPANDTEFTNISASDGSRWKTSDPGYGDEVFMWFQQTTDEYAPGVKQIDLTFEGYSDTTATFQIRAYNNNTGVWDQIGTTMSITTGSDSTMTRSITSNCSDYIDSTNLGMLNWGVYAAVTDQMNIDYVKAVVSYATCEEMTNYLPTIWLTDAACISPTNVYAVGFDYPSSSGAVLHYDGTNWIITETASASELFGVWAAPTGEVYFTGQQNGEGVILCLSDGSWSTLETNTNSTLVGIWGTSTNNIFAVGYDGTILHYNGNAWSPMTSGTDTILWGVWGSSSSDIFATGDGGVILHYNGSAWSSMPNGAGCDIEGIWGTSSSDVFAAATDAGMLHYNGSAWSPMTIGIACHDVWGTASNNVFAACQGGIMHYNGTSWSQIYNSAETLLYGISGTSSADVFAVGINGQTGTTTIVHYH